MGTPWDRAASKYVEEWVPRFVPFQLDLVREMVLAPGQRALVVSAGPGAEVLAVARAVGPHGYVRATDTSAEMVGLCRARLEEAGFTGVACDVAQPDEVFDGGFHAIVCSFGLWRLSDRTSALQRWASALAPSGKVGVLTFGPPAEDDPFEMLVQALSELEPATKHMPARVDGEREAMKKMFDAGGLSLVRHTRLTHVVAFPTAEAFVEAAKEGRTWGRVWAELGPERMGKVTARFYDRVGGPETPLTFEPAVTLAIAGLPGAEVELITRPSVTVPPLSGDPKS